MIELLAVIAIIALLAALLFPSISSALARAHAVRCQSNLRQIGVAVTVNASMKDQDLPRNETADSRRHFYWGQYAVGLERALAEALGSEVPVDANRATGNPVFICPASSLRWDASILKYRARGVDCDNNSYEGLYYNYKLSTLNSTVGDTDASAVPQITKLNWYTSPVVMPFQWCSIRLTRDPVMAAAYNVSVLAARSWHGETTRPVLFLDGHVKILTRPEYTQHSSQAILTGKLAPNKNYSLTHDGWNNAWNGGDFSTAEH